MHGTVPQDPSPRNHHGYRHGAQAVSLRVGVGGPGSLGRAAVQRLCPDDGRLPGRHVGARQDPQRRPAGRRGAARGRRRAADARWSPCGGKGAARNRRRRRGRPKSERQPCEPNADLAGQPAAGPSRSPLRSADASRDALPVACNEEFSGDAACMVEPRRARHVARAMACGSTACDQLRRSSDDER
jgi:hypothetical protein